MIEYINKRLIDWALWTKRREDGGQGYSGVASYCNMVSTHGSSGAGPVVLDAPEMEIERIVRALRLERIEQYAVVHWVYLAGNLTMERVARELKCHRDTVYVRLHALHLQVMNAMFDATIEAEDRAEAERARMALTAKIPLAKIRQFS